MRPNRIIVCPDIRSLHNVGAVFRTADAAGWGGVLICGYTGAPPDRRIEKVSLGAENALWWEQNENAAKAILELKKEGYCIIGLEQTADSTDIFDVGPLPQRRALVLGNEVLGISDELLRLCDRVVEIPMRGAKQSLNVSVACGVALYALGE